MCALTSQLFPNFGWSLDDLTNYQQQHYIHRDTQTPDSVIQSPVPQPQIQLDRCASFTVNSGDPTVVKKLNHNASERDRRKRINTLYSSLRSLLPPADQKKKLSIPSTVSHVLKYIPELQQQVEKLTKKKEELISNISKQGNVAFHQENQRKYMGNGSSLSTVSASRVSEREVVIQISTWRLHKSPLSEILLYLEEDGLFLTNASSFESFGGRIFYTLHFEVDRIYRLECEVLNEKLLSLYEMQYCHY